MFRLRLILSVAIMMSTSSGAFATKTMECVQNNEGSLFYEQQFRLKPPISINGKRVHYIKLRSALKVATELGTDEPFSIVGRGMRIYAGENSEEGLLIRQLDGTTDPNEIISQVSQLGGYNTDCVIDYSNKLDEKLPLFNAGNPMSELYRFKAKFVPWPYDASNF
ncbi:hypothetical protein [Endozoicomonas sp. SESOKO2]|uniref:hypothetical protein n=1 Tax=Endozoicomonas sp. SESOKO2 TaxID=2828743 RepID=UPI0021472E73|nr:hypothetical protein [Endozoicomonas sp. SESOKO2]